MKRSDETGKPAQPASRSPAEERRERLAEALRENLRRRKAQERGRAETAGKQNKA